MIVSVQRSQQASATGGRVVLMCLLEGLGSQREETERSIVPI